MTKCKKMMCLNKWQIIWEYLNNYIYEIYGSTQPIVILLVHLCIIHTICLYQHNFLHIFFLISQPKRETWPIKWQVFLGAPRGRLRVVCAAMEAFSAGRPPAVWVHQWKPPKWIWLVISSLLLHWRQFVGFMVLIDWYVVCGLWCFRSSLQ